MKKFKVSKELAQKVLGVVDKGLSCGLGEPKPGQMCVEAAVCYAMGLPHSDQPTCVHPVVRNFKIWLNDKNWKSKKSRARGLREIAVAQLGSNKISIIKFTKSLVDQIIRIFPLIDRKDYDWEWHWGELLTFYKKSNLTATECRMACELIEELFSKTSEHDILEALADAGLKALKDANSPGIKYLYLCDDDYNTIYGNH